MASCYMDLHMQVKRKEADSGSKSASDHLQHLTEYACLLLPADMLLFALVLPALPAVHGFARPAGLLCNWRPRQDSRLYMQYRPCCIWHMAAKPCMSRR